MQAGENQSDMEAELELEEPTDMGGDTSTSEDEGDQGVIATSVERRESTAASADGGRDTKRHGNVPMSRKRAVSSYAVGEWETKRTWSPRSSEALPALSPPAPSAVG